MTATQQLRALRFGGSWRHYQALALEAFEADRRAGRRSTHLVAPPGSGKTLLGIEVLRRLGRPALVLAPNSAIQGQWLAAVEGFGLVTGLAAAEPGEAPVTCLTRRPVFDDFWTAVPDDLTTRRDRAEAYAAAWRRNVGPTTLLFAQRGEGRDARAAAEARSADSDVQVREVWM